MDMGVVEGQGMPADPTGAQLDSLPLAPKTRRISGYLGWIVFGTELSALLGWIFDISYLKAVVPGLTTMNFNTAAAFLAAGLNQALFLPSKSRPGRMLSIVLAVSVAMTGFLTLGEYFYQVDLGIDQWFLKSNQGELFPGRMPPITAVGFALAGSSILASALKLPRLAQWSAIPLLMISMVSLVGYAYEVSSLDQAWHYSSMALNTALSFHLLALSVLAFSPDHNILRILLSDTLGGMTARRLLLLIPTVIFLSGWVAVLCARRGAIRPIFAMALLVVVCILFSASMVIWHATVLHRTDLARRKSVAEVLSLNASLEQRVEQRTRQLQDTLDHVKRLQGLLPVCAWCKKVRDDHNYWRTLESYLTENADVRVTHGICPDCYQRSTPP